MEWRETLDFKRAPKEPTGHILFSRCLCRPHTKQEELYRNLRRKDHLEANSVHTTEVPQEINFTIFSYPSSKHALLLPSKDLHYMHVMEEDKLTERSLQITLVCVFCGCICVTTTIVLLIATLWDRTVTPYAKWVGFVAGTQCLQASNFCYYSVSFSVIFFCLAAVTFPIGFSQEAIGGAPYQLPNSYQARNIQTV